MNGSRQFLRQQSIDQSLTVDRPKPDESRRLHGDIEMALASRSRAGVAGVPVGIIVDDQMRGAKPFDQLATD